MAHEIEQFEDGSAAFVSAREDAWHKLGTVTEGAMTAEEALDMAKLSGWDVRKLPLTASSITTEGVASVEVPGWYATARTNPVTGRTDVLGVVGGQYVPVQNEANAAILNQVSHEAGAHFETAGSLYGGRQVFVTMKLPDTMTIGGRDAVDTYIAALNSHDGSTAFRLVVTPVRIVCANTQAVAERRALSSWSIRHTESAEGRIEEARRALGLALKYQEEFEAEAERLIAAEMSYPEFRAFTEKLWKPPAESAPERAVANYNQRTGMLSHLFNTAETQENIRGTRWAALQAVTEYADHYAPARTAESRATRTITSGEIAGLKAKAASLLLAA